MKAFVQVLQRKTWVVGPARWRQASGLLLLWASLGPEPGAGRLPTGPRRCPPPPAVVGLACLDVGVATAALAVAGRVEVAALGGAGTAVAVVDVVVSVVPVVVVVCCGGCGEGLLAAADLAVEPRDEHPRRLLAGGAVTARVGHVRQTDAGAREACQPPDTDAVQGGHQQM